MLWLVVGQSEVSQRQRRGKRPLLFKALQVLLGLMVGLSLSECIVRTSARWLATRHDIETGAFIEDWRRVHVPALNPRIGYQMAPNLDIQFYGAELQTNSRGLRAPEVARSPADGTLRIVGLGDSVMLGWGVAQDEHCLARLEAELSGRLSDVKVETINFATAGYDTVQEYYVLRDEALAYDPDVIIVGFVGNDFERDNFIIKEPWLKTPLWSLNYASFVLQRRLAADSLDPKAIVDWRVYQDPGSFHPTTVWTALDGIASLGRSAAVPVVVVLDSRYQMDIASHAEVAAHCRKQGMHVLDLHALLRGAALDELAQRALPRDEPAWDAHARLFQLTHDGHPNELWHELTATLVADLLVREGLVGSASQSAPTAGERVARALEAADWSRTEEVSYVVGSPDERHGLWLVGGRGDGLHRRVGLGGRRGRQTVFMDGEQTGYLYFQVHDTFHFGRPGTLRVTIDYFDDGAEDVFLDYAGSAAPASDEPAEPYRRVAVGGRGGRSVWKSATVDLPHAVLANAQNHRADFRLVAEGTPLTIAAVRIARRSP